MSPSIVVKSICAIVATVVVALGLLVGGTNAVVLISADRDILPLDQVEGRGADAIVVLGASVYPDGSPSDILKARLDDAVALYNAGAAPKIIASGDNRELHYNESMAMKAYMVDQGVPSEDVFCDFAGFSTYESMYRARYVFGASSIVVATQGYHLPRAIYSAQVLGMNAVGVAPEGDHAYQDQGFYDFREIPARTKDFLQAFSRSPSTYVGDPIDLSGSGDDQL